MSGMAQFKPKSLALTLQNHWHYLKRNSQTPFPIVVSTSSVKYESTSSFSCDLRARFEAFLIANICSLLVCDNSSDVQKKMPRIAKIICLVFFIYDVFFPSNM